MDEDWQAPLMFLPEDAAFRYGAGDTGRELADRSIRHCCNPDGDRYEVRQGEYMLLKETDDAVLATDNLFSCVAVAAYDRDGEVGFLSHMDYDAARDEDHMERLYEELEGARLDVTLAVGPEPMEPILASIEEALQSPPDDVEIDEVELVYTGGEEGAGSLTFDCGGRQFCR